MRWLIVVLSLLLFGVAFADNMEGANPAAEQNEYNRQAEAANVAHQQMNEQQKASDSEALQEFFNQDKYKYLHKYKAKAAFKVPEGS